MALPPRPFDPARAGRALEALADKGFVPDGFAREIFAALFGNSPYLARIALREHAFLHMLAERDVSAVMDEIVLSSARAFECENALDVMAMLRRAKRQAALAIAFADISGAWPLDEVTTALTRFADACVGGALRFALTERARAERIGTGEPFALERDAGFVVIAMGKYGAFELNYSSDIDLVVLYDADRFPFRKKGDARGAAVDLTKELIRLLSASTADGYVFRTDLRLRPDAGATQAAISTEAAAFYYESMGQNWERAAMIKARPCAGDLDAGRAFLKEIEPFIWRRNLDYAAIEDIHSIKRQIHAHGRHGSIAVAGHNIKLGRGGIREIEFFAQTQQLILGGRNPKLRSGRTLDAIEALCAEGFVAPETAADLARAYRFLRTLEHRLQMIEDEQTHTLPKSPEALAHVACFMGLTDVDAFGSALTAELESVRSHYAQLFEKSPPLGSATGSLVFTGVEDDPATIETLAKMGFHDPRHAARAVRGWHHGRIRATRSPRARELLTRLIPALLDALAGTADADAAFAQFDRFVSRVPAGVQLFSLLLANPGLLKTIATIAGSAPKLADTMARSPVVLDALMDRDFLSKLPSREELREMLATGVSAAADYEGVLNAARRFAREQTFRVGVQIVEGRAPADKAGAVFASIAECVIEGLLEKVADELSAASGRVDGGAFAVIAMGKLGGREMTAGSDLDLIFVYDAPAQCEASDGPKSLPPSVWFARLAQRLISALTTPTAEGVLYEVDMRLRPTGNKGPVAVSLESFRRYYLTREAWVWERLALTRARVIAGPDALRREIEATIAAALSLEFDTAKLGKDARDMREKLAAQFPAKSMWDLKFAPGGMVDIEFVAQFLQLKHARSMPRVLNTNTHGAIERLKSSSCVDAGAADTLIAACRLEQALTQVLRIAVDGVLDGARATQGLKSLLTRAGEASGFAELEEKLLHAQSQARAVFERILPQA